MPSQCVYASLMWPKGKEGKSQLGLHKGKNMQCLVMYWPLKWDYSWVGTCFKSNWTLVIASPVSLLYSPSSTAKSSVHPSLLTHAGVSRGGSGCEQAGRHANLCLTLQAYDGKTECSVISCRHCKPPNAYTLLLRWSVKQNSLLKPEEVWLVVSSCMWRREGLGSGSLFVPVGRFCLQRKRQGIHPDTL